jgi:hypothetical protein
MAHLIVIASIEYLKYKQIECKEIVEKLASQLLSRKSKEGIYKMRQKSGKDECNGVIGHAWLIEGYLYAYKVTGNPVYLSESESICKKHKFDKSLSLWCRPLSNSIDFTFNHQLWYADTLAELLKYVDSDELKQQLNNYKKNLPKNLNINRVGRIAHTIYRRSSFKDSLLKKISKYRDAINELFGLPGLKYRETGYHMFNLMAFARLYMLSPNEPFFKSKVFLKALSFVCQENYSLELLNSNTKDDRTLPSKLLTLEEKSINIYGYPYNVPGFEIMFCSKVFNGLIPKSLAHNILSTQMIETLDENTGLLGKKCHDKITINYRIYEYYRYLELL